MDIDTNGWFTELPPMWPGQAFYHYQKVKEDFVYKKSKYQDPKICKSNNLERQPTSDDTNQDTERNQTIYQEMATFLPLNSHPNPERVLVFSGNDAGIIKKLSKHPNVKEIYLCKLNEETEDSCNIYSPPTRRRSSTPNIKYFSCHEKTFLENSEEKFDVIIADFSSNVVGGTDEERKTEEDISNSLVNDQFYSKMKQMLRSGGILCCQGENIWLHSSRIAKRIEICLIEYPIVDYAYTCVPSYSNGQIGFILCSLNEKTNFREPLLKWNDEDMRDYSLKYYCEEAHKSAFILPPFINKLLP